MSGQQITAFSEDELYLLWVNFKDLPDASAMLSDFMDASKADATKLICRFEIKYEASLLDSDSRGKENRYRKHI